MNYSEYIWGEVWGEKRKLFLDSWGNYCRICNKHKNLYVHHLHYKTLGMEGSKDLIAVCKDCHNKIHENKLKGDEKVWNFEETKEGKTAWD